jgi:hypothetical protein
MLDITGENALLVAMLDVVSSQTLLAILGPKPSST